jgi:hypothetical protein
LFGTRLGNYRAGRIEEPLTPGSTGGCSRLSGSQRENFVLAK